MRSCFNAQPVRKLNGISPLIRSSIHPSPLLQRPAHPSINTHQQHRTMNVAAAAVPALNAALAGLSIGVLAAWIDARLKSRKPDLFYTPTEFNSAVLDRCPTVQSTYQCTPFLTNGHAETILVAKLRKGPGVVYKREILVTKDGGAVAIDWEHVDDDGKDLPEDAPVLVLFPGLTGGSGDSYVQHAVLQARHAGVRAAVFNSRGTADSPVLTPQFYSASFTDDTREVIDHVRKRYPASTMFAAGWSLGANILVNYLGEQGPDTPLEAAVSMCNPFDLTISNRHINEGFNKIYNWNLANALKCIFLKHQPLWRSYQGPGQPERVPEVTTIREFDEAITVHSFDWADVDAYYAGSSSAKRIPNVAIPLLCIQAADDPIAPEEAIPYEAIKQNPNCTLVVTPCGGHLGWAAGPGAPFSEPWTDAAVVEWLTSVHAQLQQQKAAEAGRTAQQQLLQQQAAAATNGNGNGVQAVPGSDRRDQDDDEDGNGGNGAGGSNGSSGGVARDLEAVGVGAAGRAGSSSSALTAATPLSRQASSSSSGSSTFISPVSSPASSSSAARPSTAGSSDGGSSVRLHLAPHQQQQQQKLSMLAAAESEPAELMEQLWWGQGASLPQPNKVQDTQQQQQQQRPQHRQLQVERLVVDAEPQHNHPTIRDNASAEPAAAAVAVCTSPAHEQQAVRVSPYAAAATTVGPLVADAAAAPAPEHAAAAVVAVAAGPASSSEECVASSPRVAGAAAEKLPAAAAVKSAVEDAEAALWQSVRWAF